MKVVNLTPHDVVVRLTGRDVVFPRSGQQARVAVTQTEVAVIDSIPVVRNVYGEVQGLPAPERGTIYIVSAQVLERAGGRHDVFAPDTSPAGVVRDAEGRIIAVKRLVAAP